MVASTGESCIAYAAFPTNTACAANTDSECAGWKMYFLRRRNAAEYHAVSPMLERTECRN